MSKYNLDVMDGERLLLDGRGKRLSQGCDKNAQRRKRDRILQEWTYMPDSIRRKERRNIGKTKKDRLRNARLQDTEWRGRLGSRVQIPSGRNGRSYAGIGCRGIKEREMGTLH